MQEEKVGKLNIGIGISEIKKITMTSVEKTGMLESIFHTPLATRPLLSPYRIYSLVTKIPRSALNLAIKYSSPIIREGVVKPIRGAYTLLMMDVKEIDKKFEKKKTNN